MWCALVATVVSEPRPDLPHHGARQAVRVCSLQLAVKAIDAADQGSHDMRAAHAGIKKHGTTGSRDAADYKVGAHLLNKVSRLG